MMKSKAIMKSILVFILAVLVVGIATAGIEVFRLERNTETEQLVLVGVDGVRREVCICSPEEYAVMTGQVDKVWRGFNSSEDGRVKLHGNRVEQVIDKDAKTKTSIYEDGYCYVEKMEFRSRAPFSAKVNTKKVNTNRVNNAIMVKPSNISERQWRMRQALEIAKKRIPKEVTIEHDAATGKDTVK